MKGQPFRRACESLLLKHELRVNCSKDANKDGKRGEIVQILALELTQIFHRMGLTKKIDPFL